MSMIIKPGTIITGPKISQCLVSFATNFDVQAFLMVAHDFCKLWSLLSSSSMNIIKINNLGF